MTLRTYRLDTSRQTLVLAAEGTALPQVIHWGPPLPTDEDLATLAGAHALDVTGGMLDANPDLSICPEARRSFPGQPGLVLRDENGAPLTPRFDFVDDETGPDHLILRHADDTLGLTYEARFEADPETHVLTLEARLQADRPVRVDWFAAPVLPGPVDAVEMIDVSGRWIGEFQLNRVRWTPGLHLRENRTGRTGHEHFPGLIVPRRATTNTEGGAWGFHYGWSGGHRMLAEELPDGRRQIQWGHATGIDSAPGTRFETAPLYVTYGEGGLNGVGTAFQRHARDRIVTWPHPDRPRPVHYNCWEAVYFNHDLATLREIATHAADLGAERFVLDDGWFGQRDDDTSSLGDWVVDRRKWPDGLGPLIDHVRALGMTFGLWFEPEMVNARSDLARAHPDWVLGPADQVLGRHQMVLDLANEAVRDYLFDRISALLGDYAIDYIKWDHNRVLPTPDAAQTRGTYALLDRLRAAFPAVEIESCASGGGRIDFGILRRTQRVWLSDSNDALERLRIQSGAALFLPAAITGSHVGPRHCHTSGRVLDIRFRAWVAAQRHMGFEMDPRELDDHETRVLKEVTAWWKANRDWMRGADILRLDPPGPEVIAEVQIAREGDRFVVFAGVADTAPQILPRPLRLARLDPDARYRLRLATEGAGRHLSRGKVALRDGPLEVSGAWLMAHGVTLPWSFPLHMWVIEGERIG